PADANGRVRGTNDQSETNNTTAGGEGSSSGVGFAIPANTVAQIANQIIAGKAVEHAYVGVVLSGSSSGGTRVAKVQAGGPGAQAGLAGNDLITAINGKTVTSTDQFIATIDNYQPGQTVTMTVHRGGKTLSVKVKLGTRPASTPSGG